VRESLWGLPLVTLLAFASGLAGFDPMPPGGQWLSFFGLMLVPALGEELVFRVLLVPPPDRPFPAWRAVLGILLVRLYRITGSIWPCVLIHWLVAAAWKLLFAGPIG